MRDGWATQALGDICRVIGGGTPSKSRPEFYDGSIPWATVGDMQADRLGTTVSRISEDAVRQSATNVIPAGNVVIATRVGLGKICMLEQDTAINQDLRGIIPLNPSRISESYLFWWFKSIADRIVAEGTGATVQGVKVPFVKGLSVPVPPLSEQLRIAGILDEAFGGILTARAYAEKNLRNASALFESHIQSVFTERGDGWTTKALGDVCVVRDGTHDSPQYVENGIPFVTQKNIRRDGLSFEKTRFIRREDHDLYYRRSNAAHGDILISMIGANRGMACIVDDERIFSIKNVGLVKQNEAMNQPFLLHFLKSPQAADYVRVSSRGGAQEFIGLAELRRFPVPVPPLESQEKLARRFAALLRESQRLESVYQRKLAALDELKKSLLHKAFSGGGLGTS